MGGGSERESADSVPGGSFQRGTDAHPLHEGSDPPRPHRLTDPPRDGHRGAPSQVWRLLGWCLRALGEPEGGEGDPLG